MKIIIKLFILGVVTVVLANCGRANQKTTSTARGGQPLRHPEDISGKPIPPNYFRIIGTIMAVDTTFLSTDPDNPCSRLPCRATVRIDSVLGYGQGFLYPLSPGSEIAVTFRYTLSPTRGLFPAMTADYPGLSVNSRFRADVEERQVLRLGGGSSVTYTVYGYELR